MTEQLTIEQLIEQQAETYAFSKVPPMHSEFYIYLDSYKDGLTEAVINNPDQFGLFTITDIKEYDKQIETLNAIVEMKEQQRKGWADMCLDKQKEIDRLKHLIWAVWNIDGLEKNNAVWQKFKTQHNL